MYSCDNTPLFTCNIYSYKETEHYETTTYIHKIIINKIHFIITIQFASCRCRKKNGHFDTGYCSDGNTRLEKFGHQQSQFCMLLFTSYLMLHVLASSIDIIRLSKHSKKGGSIEYKHDIIIHSWDLNNVLYFNSNKSPTRCNNFPVYYPDVYLQLNMFRASSRPSSGAQQLQ